MTQFLLNCLDPRTEAGQGFLLATVISFVVDVVWGAWRGD